MRMMNPRSILIRKSEEGFSLISDNLVLKSGDEFRIKIIDDLSGELIIGKDISVISTDQNVLVFAVWFIKGCRAGKLSFRL